MRRVVVGPKGVGPPGGKPVTFQVLLGSPEPLPGTRGGCRESASNSQEGIQPECSAAGRPGW